MPQSSRKPAQADGTPDMAEREKSVRIDLPERPEGGLAQINADTFFSPNTPPIVEARPVGHRLGPLVVWHAVEGRVVGRLYALVFAAIGLAVLAAAGWMTPDRSHLGTHRQLGLPPCAFVAVTGFPCPTCGMTTSFSFVVRGRLFEAAKSSLFGSFLAISTVVLTAAGLVCSIIGRYPNLNWYRVDAVKVVYLGALVLV